MITLTHLSCPYPISTFVRIVYKYVERFLANSHDCLDGKIFLENTNAQHDVLRT